MRNNGRKCAGWTCAKQRGAGACSLSARLYQGDWGRTSRQGPCRSLENVTKTGCKGSASARVGVAKLRLWRRQLIKQRSESRPTPIQRRLRLRAARLFLTCWFQRPSARSVDATQLHTCAHDADTLRVEAARFFRRRRARYRASRTHCGRRGSSRPRATSASR